MKCRPFRCRTYGAGPAVVLIPGLDGLTEFFSELIPELARHYTVVRYELPLLGDARAAGVDYSFDYLARDLKSTLDELGIQRAHIVGESFGGVVAQTFALACAASVQTLTLISSAPHFELSTKNRLLLPLFRITPMWLFARVHLHDVCEPHDPQWAKDLFVRGASYADHASVYARARIVARVDLRARVHEIQMPVLLVIGAADQFTGAASRALAQMLPDARCVAIAGGGHLCHLTHPHAFLDALLPFLGNHAESRSTH